MALCLACLSLVVRAAGQPPDADRLYDGREQIELALQAADIWEARARDGRDFDAAWKLARATYWLGGHVPAAGRKAQYERGIAAARLAVALEPDRPEGHFWLAANMGAMAESFGLRAGIRYRGPVKRELETTLRLAPTYEAGAADRALGRWYYRVPGLFGGSKTKAVEHLQRSLTYDPASPASRVFLAETFLAMGRRDDARRELLAALDGPLDPAWVPEGREFRARARALLATLP